MCKIWKKLSPYLIGLFAMFLLQGISSGQYDNYAKGVVRSCESPKSTCIPCEKPSEKSCDTPRGSCDKISVTECVPECLFRVHEECLSNKCAVGDKANFRVEVTAMHAVTNVTIEVRIPEGVTLVSSNPQATPTNGKLIWSLDGMKKGECKQIDLFFCPKTEGDHFICTVVKGDPVVCSYLCAGIPKLELTKEGPCWTEIDCNVTWNITVRNTGSAAASDVKVKDMLPDGFTPVSATEFDICELKPCESKSFCVTATATKTGDFVNTSSVIASCMDTAIQATAPISVKQAMLSITKSGPAEAYVMTCADYTLTVSNTGQIPLNNVRVLDCLPEHSQVLEACEGRVECDKIFWHLGCLNPGQSKNLNVRLTSNCPGTATNTAMVKGSSTCKCLEDKAQVTTNWLAAPGITACIKDAKDPIRVGECNEYTAEITNQGSFKDINVDASITFSPEVSLVSVNSTLPAKIVGNKVVCDACKISPGQTVIIKVTAKAEKTGIAQANLEVKADFLPQTRIDQETTTIY